MANNATVGVQAVVLDQGIQCSAAYIRQRPNGGRSSTAQRARTLSQATCMITELFMRDMSCLCNVASPDYERVGRKRRWAICIRAKYRVGCGSEGTTDWQARCLRVVYSMRTACTSSKQAEVQYRSQRKGGTGLQVVLQQCRVI